MADAEVNPVAGPPPPPRPPQYEAHRIGLTPRERWFTWAMIILLILAVAGSLVSQQIQQASFENGFNANRQEQARQSAMLGKKLCTTLGTLAALKPPPGGNTDATAGRLYEQKLAATLGELYGDVGCKK